MPALEPDVLNPPEPQPNYELAKQDIAPESAQAQQTVNLSKRLQLISNYEYQSPFKGVYDLAARKAAQQFIDPLRYQLAASDAPDDVLHGYLQQLQMNAVKQKAQQDYQTALQNAAPQYDAKTGLLLERKNALMGVTPDLTDAMSLTGLIGKDVINRAKNIAGGVVSSPLRFADHLGRTLDDYMKTSEARGHHGSLTGAIQDLGFLPQAWTDTKVGPGNLGSTLADALGLKPGTAPYKTVAFAGEFYLTTAMDPIVIASKMHNIANAAIADALAHDPGAIVDYTTSASFQRAAKAISNMNDAGTISRYVRRAGGDVAPETLRALVRAKTADEVTQVFNDGFRGINGFSAGAVRNIPHVWPGVLGMAKMNLPRLPKLLEALPEKHFDLTQPGTLTQIQRAADMFNFSEGEVNTFMDRFVNATTKADKLSVMDDIYAQGLNKLGLSPERLRALEQTQGRWFDPFREQMTQFGAQKFAGLDEERPILESQLAYAKNYPDWRTIKQAKALIDGGAAGLGEKAIQDVNKVAYGIMSPLKRIWLLRPAWITKISMDEALNNLAHGDITFSEYARHVSGSLLQSMEMSDSKLIRFIGEGWDRFSSALEKVPGLRALSPSELPEAATEALPEMPSRLSMASHGHDWLSSSAAPSDIAKDEEDLVKSLAKLDKRFDYKSWAWLDNNAPGHTESWYRVANHQVLNDRVTAIMAAYHDEPALADQLARAWLQGPEGQQYVRSLRGTFGGGSQAIEDIISSHRAMYEHIIPEALRPLAAQGRLTMDDLLSVPQDSRPSVWGRPVVGTDPGGRNLLIDKAKSFTDWGYRGMGHTIDTMVRDPAWQVLQEKEFSRLAEIAKQTGTLGTTISEEELGRIASQYATREFATRIHNPLERTKLDSMLEAHIPFAFAQVQFYKRWARVFAENPGFVRQASLFMGAAYNAGWYEKDDQGNLIFNIPVAPELFNAVFSKEVPSALGLFNKAFSVEVHPNQQLPGGIPGAMLSAPKALDWLTVPEGLPFSGHYEPGFAPWLSFPAAALVSSRPGWKDVRDFLTGSSSNQESPPGTGWLQQLGSVIAPAWLDKISKAFHGDQGDRQWANATKLVMAYMTANGMDPFDKANQAKAQGWTKLLYVTRGLDQLFSPYTPVPNIPGGNFVNEYRQDTTKYGYEVGTKKFLDKYPDGVLYTVPLTQTGKGALSATQESYDWANKNPDFVKKYPNVAYLFAPTGNFDRDIYEQQIGSGDRKVLTLQEWLTRAAQRLGDDVYYSQIRPAYVQAQKNNVDKTQLHDWLMAKQNQLDSIYPGWKDWHDQSTMRADQKQEAISEVQRAAFDPAVAKTKDGKAVEAFLIEYNQAFNAVQQAGYATWNSNALDPIKEQLYSRYQSIQGQYQSPVLDRVFNSLFKSTILTFEE